MSRTFTVEPGVKSVTVRYRFIDQGLQYLNAVIRNHGGHTTHFHWEVTD